MARFRAGEEEHYGGQGGGGYFSLKNDGDVAKVRFMYNSIDDVEGFAVHQVEIDGKKRYVNCLREYNDPVSKCPFCRERQFQTAKLFIPIYNIDEDRVQTWERGKKYFAKISSLCARYPNLVSHIFEIERHGKAGDTGTTYEIYETGSDDTTLDDLPEVASTLGTIVLDKTAEDMEYYLESGQFPPTDGGETIRRRVERHEEEHPVRRTPATRRERF